MIASVICYCTNDYRFIAKCIEEVQKFSDQILIPVCDHFYDGSPENRVLLENTYANHSACEFIEFAYDPKRLYTPYLSYTSADREWPSLWHSTSRYIGYLHTNPKIEYILFLDCDEIIEGDRFADWIRQGEYKKWEAMRFTGFYYILQSRLRAKMIQELALFAKREAARPLQWIQPGERYALFHSITGRKNHLVQFPDKKPLIHHYSWVRPQTENLHKSAIWGHRKDGDWEAMILDSFRGKKLQEFFGVDFEFEEIASPYFDPLAMEIPTETRAFPPPTNVKKVNSRAILEMELDALE